MNTPDENKIGENAVAANGLGSGTPICQPIGLAFPPIMPGQASVTGLVTLSRVVPPGQTCTVTITSSNNSLFTPQPQVTIKGGQTTAPVIAIVSAPQVVAGPSQSSQNSSVAIYAIATGDGGKSNFARISVPTGGSAFLQPGTVYEITGFTFNHIAAGATQATAFVTFEPAITDGTEVTINITSTNTDVLLPQQNVSVNSGDTAQVLFFVTPPAADTPVTVFASIGDQMPFLVTVDVPAG